MRSIPAWDRKVEVKRALSKTSIARMEVPSHIYAVNDPSSLHPPTHHMPHAVAAPLSISSHAAIDTLDPALLEYARLQSVDRRLQEQKIHELEAQLHRSVCDCLFISSDCSVQLH